MPVGRKIAANEDDGTTAGTVARPMLTTAHLVVLAAKRGDPHAQAVLTTTAGHAYRTGAADAVAVTQVYDYAAQMQARADYVRHWLYGDGAAKVKGGR
jgi:hypothetical protein